MTTMRRMGGQRSNPFPLSPKDLKTLIEMGLVEMRDDAPKFTAKVINALVDGWSNEGAFSRQGMEATLDVAKKRADRSMGGRGGSEDWRTLSWPARYVRSAILLPTVLKQFP